MEEFDQKTIGRRSARGVLALVSRTIFLQLISFGAVLLTASQLPTIDWGIVTIATAMQRVVNFFTDFGLGAALVQKKEALTQADLSTSFTIQAFLTFFIFLLVFLSRDVLASFFHLGMSGSVLLLVLVFSIFVSSFKTIPSILLERAIRFEKLIIPQIAESIAYNGVLIVLLLRGFGVDSFSYAFFTSSLIGIPFYYLVSPWNVEFAIDRESLQHLKFGLQFQGKNILATMKDDLLTIMLPRLLSLTEIGYIGFAQRLAFFMYRFIVDSITRVTFSAYARIQDDRQRLSRAIEKSLFSVGSVMFPILVGLILTAPYFVRYFPKWHNKWEGALLSLTFFCLNALVSSLSGILVNVLDSSGKVKTTLKLMVLWTVLVWVLTPIFIFIYGYNGVALVSFLITLTIFVTIYLVKQIVHFEFINSVYKPLVSTIVMGVCVYVLLPSLAKDLVTLLMAIILAAFIYVATLYIIAKEEVGKIVGTAIVKP